MVIPKNASASLAAMGDAVTLGFDAGASDWASPLTAGMLTKLTNSSLAIPQISAGSIGDGNPLTIGNAGTVFGCVFQDASVTAMLDIDVWYYDY